ncbi:hypothetical protein JB92DRAFT_2860248 [Gautieria morchelliformis]|nr:hypothetical protein JB92DRAFT_2860248 [Gautieria morchelliformis]
MNATVVTVSPEAEVLVSILLSLCLCGKTTGELITNINVRKRVHCVSTRLPFIAISVTLITFHSLQVKQDSLPIIVSWQWLRTVV